MRDRAFKPQVAGLEDRNLLSALSGTVAEHLMSRSIPNGFSFGADAVLVLDGVNYGHRWLEGSVTSTDGVNYKGFVGVGFEMMTVNGTLDHMKFTITGVYDRGQTGFLSITRGPHGASTITF